MKDQIVTYADLQDLREAKAVVHRHLAVDGPAGTLLDRLIAAAEADAPDYPLGTVAHITRRGGQRLVGQRVALGPGGSRLAWQVGTSLWFDSGVVEVEPVRPAVTESDMEQAATAIYRRLGTGVGVSVGKAWEIAYEAFEAAGIEVQS